MKARLQRKPFIRFGRLVLVGEARNSSGNKCLLCRCDCGNAVLVLKYDLNRKGGTRSCGCYKKDRMQIIGSVVGEHKEKHLSSNTKPYHVWREMKQRCYNENNKRYKNYGGRGIKVCDRWRNSFTEFYNDMGEKPSESHSLDRKDNDGDYTPENCQWATASEQQSNKRSYAKA